MSASPQPIRPAGIKDLIFRILFTRQLAEKECSHLDMIEDVAPTTDVCQDCVGHD
jgi:hypothetical protein